MSIAAVSITTSLKYRCPPGTGMLSALMLSTTTIAMNSAVMVSHSTGLRRRRSSGFSHSFVTRIQSFRYAFFQKSPYASGISLTRRIPSSTRRRVSSLPSR